MLNSENIQNISTIKKWLDDISYQSLNKQLNTFLGQEHCIYPDFSLFMSNIDRLNPLYSFIFSVFRFGQSADLFFFKIFISEDVFNALVNTGLLIKNNDTYSMPEICILPLDGLYFITSLPKSYPTCSHGNPLSIITTDYSLIANELKRSENDSDNFLEFDSDYGVLSNFACLKGYQDVSVIPSDNAYKDFISFNLKLNNNKATITNRETLINNENKFNLIASINLYSHEINYDSFINNSITREEFIFPEKIVPITKLLNPNAIALIIIESLGNIYSIHINEKFNNSFKSSIKAEVSSLVLSKFPLHFHFHLYKNSILSETEKTFKTNDLQHNNKNIKSSEDIYVFKQVIKVKLHDNTDSSFVSYPFYNPKYSDPLFGIANYINQNQTEL